MLNKGSFICHHKYEWNNRLLDYYNVDVPYKLKSWSKIDQQKSEVEVTSQKTS
jgi:hypothetical protein